MLHLRTKQRTIHRSYPKFVMPYVNKYRAISKKATHIKNTDPPRAVL